MLGLLTGSPAPLTKAARLAIMKEIRSSARLTLEQDGMLLRFDPSNIQIAYMVLLGPDSTPYEHCFFLFKFWLSPRHPSSPPRATYLTNNGTYLFNPNLYIDGKVCLSIFGTWSGPGWQPSTLECVGQTLRAAVFVDTPIRCEPAFSSYSGSMAAPYSRLVEFHSLDFSIEQAIRSPPEGFAEFRDQLAAFFLSHMDFYAAKLEWLQTHCEGEPFGLPYRTTGPTYGASLEKLKSLYRELSHGDFEAEGDGGFDPTQRIWYHECDPEVIERRAAFEPNGTGGTEYWNLHAHELFHLPAGYADTTPQTHPVISAVARWARNGLVLILAFFLLGWLLN
jgi:ubiquitin-protein ligase